MATDNKELNAILAELNQGKTATPVSIRTFLSWFGAQRRSLYNVEYINKELEKAGLRTVPNYLNIWVDTPITFELVSEHAGPNVVSEVATEKPSNESASDPLNDGPTSKSASALTFNIGRIPSATIPVTSVKPNATLEEAVTLMISRNFSQLPVMTNDYTVKGVVSWASIGTRHATGVSGADVQSYMDEHYETLASASLFDAINIIVANSYVLVRSQDNKISGIVTLHDVANQFSSLSTPFLLLSDIENGLRQIIDNKLTLDDIKNSCSPEFLPAELTHIHQLTFGNYIRIFENPENWNKIGLKLDRTVFCRELSEINTIRNEIMHFDPDPPLLEDLEKLKNAAKMLEVLRKMGVC